MNFILLIDIRHYIVSVLVIILDISFILLINIRHYSVSVLIIASHYISHITY